MNNDKAWEQEYRHPQFLSLGTEALTEVKEFMRWIKKGLRKNPEDFSGDLTEYTVLDLGCGNGKNLNYIVENYARGGIGYDISETAIAYAKQARLSSVAYEVRSIADPFPIPDRSIDIVLDVTASNSLTNKERGQFLSEIARVIKPSGLFFTRALAKDGDANAKNLIKQFPGNEPDTYVLGQTGITERVFSKQDLIDTYSEYFEIVHLEKTTGYQKWGNQSYKRNYWIMYAKIK